MSDMIHLSESDPIRRKIADNVKSHLILACEKDKTLKSRVRTGNYSFHEIDKEKPVFVGKIFSAHGHAILTDGSIRYGDCLAVPDGRGAVHLVFLGVKSSNYEHTVVGIVMPEDATYERICTELERMWNYKHKDQCSVEEYIPASLVNVDGPILDCSYEEANDLVGKINRWFVPEMMETDRIRIGDYMETRIKKGTDSSKRLRVEATRMGFAAYVGDNQDEEGDIQEWRLIWLSPSLYECLDFAFSEKLVRMEYVRYLVEEAQDKGGFLRYINGSLYGSFYNDDTVFFVKNWLVYQLDESLRSIFFDTSLDVRNALSLCE